MRIIWKIFILSFLFVLLLFFPINSDKKQIERVVNTVFEDLISGEYEKAGSFFTSHDISRFDVSPEEFADKVLLLTHDNQAMKYKNYYINSIEHANDRVANVSISYEVLINDKLIHDTINLLAIKDNEWKLQTDNTLFTMNNLQVKKEKDSNINLNIHHFSQTTDGILLDATITNISEKDIKLKNKMVLKTNNNLYSAVFPDSYTLPPNSEGTFSLLFSGATGFPLSIELNNDNFPLEEK